MLQTAVLIGLDRAVEEIAGIVQHLPLGRDRGLAERAVDEQLFAPVAVARVPGEAEEIITELEDGPAAAADLTAAPCVRARGRGADKVSVNELARPGQLVVPGRKHRVPEIAGILAEEGFPGPVSAGGKDVARGEHIVGIADDIQVVRVFGHHIGAGGRGQAVDMAVGVARSDIILSGSQLVPEIGVKPVVGHVKIDGIPQQLIGPEQVFRQSVPFDLAVHSFVLQAVARNIGDEPGLCVLRDAQHPGFDLIAAHEFDHVQETAEEFFPDIGAAVEQVLVLFDALSPPVKQVHGLVIDPLVAGVAVPLGVGAEVLPDGRSPADHAVDVRGDAGPEAVAVEDIVIGRMFQIQSDRFVALAAERAVKQCDIPVVSPAKSCLNHVFCPRFFKKCGSIPKEYPRRVHDGNELTLDSTDHDALLEVLLHERIDAQDRDGGDDHDGILDLVG